MPVGSDTYRGLALPNQGEAELRGRSTDLDLLTLTGPSSQARDFLVLRSQVPAGSTRTDTELFNIGSSGELRAYQYLVRTISTLGGTDAANSTVMTLTAALSGGVYFTGAFSSGVNFVLPNITALGAGITYTIVQGVGASSHGANITSTAGAADIFWGLTSVASSAQALMARTTAVGSAVTLISMSTNRWLAMPHLNISTAWSTTNDQITDIGGIWGAGTTA